MNASLFGSVAAIRVEMLIIWWTVPRSVQLKVILFRGRTQCRKIGRAVCDTFAGSDSAQQH